MEWVVEVTEIVLGQHSPCGIKWIECTGHPYYVDVIS